MSRKDYINIANTLIEIKAAAVRDFGPIPQGDESWNEYVIKPFARMLEEDNPNFDPDKFIKHIEKGNSMNNFTDYQNIGGATNLPTINGYIADMRLKEFRSITNPHESIPFSSERGEELLQELIEAADPNGDGRLPSEIRALF